MNNDLLTVPTALAMARECNRDIPGRTIRYACKSGNIAGAEKMGRDWIFSHAAFMDWMSRWPNKPGRKPVV